MEPTKAIRRRRRSPALETLSKKKRKISDVSEPRFEFFDELPDDLVVAIITKVGATASCPIDFFNFLLTCKRINELAINPIVLSKASPKVFTCRAKNWSQKALNFIKSCVDAGNLEAIYTFGMIKFYCLGNRGSGAAYLAKGSLRSHAPSLYSLSVIQFNGSGGTKDHKDLRAGVALAHRAAFLGNIDALRELGHCLQDGYGIPQNVAEGRRFLMQANAREIVNSTPSSVIAAAEAAAAANSKVPAKIPIPVPTMPTPKSLGSPPWMTWLPNPNLTANSDSGSGASSGSGSGSGSPLLSDFGCNVTPREPHPANRFMTEWYEIRGGDPGNGLRLCSHEGCGRPETRKHEYRRCSVCGTVNYCSRACQALDWKTRHQKECTPMEQNNDDDGVDGGDYIDEGVVFEGEDGDDIVEGMGEEDAGMVGIEEEEADDDYNES